MRSLKGKTVALTGAGSGIGRALALGLARHGANVAMADCDAVGLAETARMLGNHPQISHRLDVTDHAALAAYLDDSATQFGGLDGIINNAGLTVVSPFADLPRADFDRVMAVNFDAVVEGCRLALPHLRARGGGFIVNISSVFGMIGYPSQSAYCASKFAVRGFTEALDIELKVTDPAIRVHRVHPGGVKTNVVASARLIAHLPGTPELADAADAFERAARTSPAVAAETILRGIERGDRRILIGGDARWIDWVTRLYPVNYMRPLTRLRRRFER
jgi:NAD(P)-dependent dehydrogenase (short-subunit alcohol dehydrogenase family)